MKITVTDGYAIYMILCTAYVSMAGIVQAILWVIGRWFK